MNKSGRAAKEISQFKTMTNFNSRNFLSFWKNESGGMAPFMVLGLAGVVLASSYAVDVTRMTSSAAQLKRATDAAAMAVTMAASGNADVDDAALENLARKFVIANLGMDRQLDDSSVTNISLIRSQGEQPYIHQYTVEAQYAATSLLLGAAEKDIVVSSTAEIISQPAEVAIAVHTGDIPFPTAEFATIKNQLKSFVNNLFGVTEESAGNGRENMYVSLVPFLGHVNVQDDSDPDRASRWAAGEGAVRPRHLQSLWNAGNASPPITSLVDPRAPDQVMKVLCMYRGDEGKPRYELWDEPAQSQMFMYYNNYQMNSLGQPQPKVTWMGRHPDFPNDPSVDERALNADSRCLFDQLLPLTDKRQTVLDRIDSLGDKGLRHAATVYTSGLSWAAATLSPQMRGDSGWGNARLPLDYAPGQNTKALVFVAKALDDYAAFEIGFSLAEVARFCSTIREKEISVFFIAIRTSTLRNNNFTRLERSFRECVNDSGEYISLFVDGLAGGDVPQLSSALDRVVEKINSAYSDVRLVK